MISFLRDAPILFSFFIFLLFLFLLLSIFSFPLICLGLKVDCGPWFYFQDEIGQYAENDPAIFEAMSKEFLPLSLLTFSSTQWHPLHQGISFNFSIRKYQSDTFLFFYFFSCIYACRESYWSSTCIS